MESLTQLLMKSSRLEVQQPLVNHQVQIRPGSQMILSYGIIKPMDGLFNKSYLVITHFQHFKLILKILCSKLLSVVIIFFLRILFKLMVHQKAMMVSLSVLVISASRQTKILIIMMFYKLESYYLKLLILQLLMLGLVLKKLFGLIILLTCSLCNLIHQLLFQLYNQMQLQLHSVFQVFAT